MFYQGEKGEFGTPVCTCTGALHSLHCDTVKSVMQFCMFIMTEFYIALLCCDAVCSTSCCTMQSVIRNNRLNGCVHHERSFGCEY